MPSKDRIAEKLARSHYRIEPEIAKIFRLSGRAEMELQPDEPIKLLEVNPNTIPSGILPLYFGADPANGMTYPSVIIEITPEEFKQIQEGKLALPDGWRIGQLLQRREGGAKEDEHL